MLQASRGIPRRWVQLPTDPLQRSAQFSSLSLLCHSHFHHYHHHPRLCSAHHFFHSSASLRSHPSPQPASVAPAEEPLLSSSSQRPAASFSSPTPPTDSHSFADTLHLPTSDFTAHFNAALHEPRLSHLHSTRLYHHQLTSPLLQPSLSSTSSPPLFLLHDGPPFANGSLHIGHFLNKTLKDISLRYHLLTGHRIHYISGWDCHGLPIELKALASASSSLTSSSSLSPLDIRRTARKFAEAAIEEQKREFQSWGILTDWNSTYLTMSPHYEAEQLAVFLSMLKQGLIYRALKPVYWSPATQTALAEAELEYKDDHVSTSVWVGFQVKGGLEERWKQLVVGVWTTTPWTLPGNQAIAYHPEMEYCVIRVGKRREEGGGRKRKEEERIEGRYILIGKERVSAFSDVLQREVSIVEDVPASSLSSLSVSHPFLPRLSPLIPGLHVTTDSGTAFVHSAPAHGADDFTVCKQHGIDEVIGLVDSEGKFSSSAPCRLSGLYTLKEGNEAVISLLRSSSSLLSLQYVTHRYPYDWRSKTPVITRATEQWFTKLEGLQDEALKEVEGVKFTPETGRSRLRGMLGGRKEWCLSRQRVWGVPIPVFYREDGEMLMTEETVEHVIALIRQHGSDCWWEMPETSLLPPRFRSDGHTYRKGTDTLDVWFDSGASWALGLKEVEEKTGVKVNQFDVYLEGSDQHRGWFQSSLLTSVAVRGVAPYRQIVTHGFVLDEEGRKMSKSIGNVIEPKTIISGIPSSSPPAPSSSSLSSPSSSKKQKKQKQRPASSPAAPGADFLRLWVASTDYTADASIGPAVLSKVNDVYRKVRGLARFMLGCLGDWEVKERIGVGEMMGVDRYMLRITADFARGVSEEYEEGRYSRVYSLLVHFMNSDLSAFYFDISKDRLYAEGKHSRKRRACRTVMAVILETLTKAISPILPHTAEDIYQHCNPHLQCLFNDTMGPEVAVAEVNSVFTHGWLSILAPEGGLRGLEGVKEEEVKRYEAVMRLRVEVMRLLELARHVKKREEGSGMKVEGKVEGDGRIGASEAEVWLELEEGALKEALKRLEEGELEMILGVANVKLGKGRHGEVKEGGVRVSGRVKVEGGRGEEDVGIVIENTEGVKCNRCWRYSESQRDDCLCARCIRVLAEQGVLQ